MGGEGQVYSSGGEEERNRLVAERRGVKFG